MTACQPSRITSRPWVFFGWGCARQQSFIHWKDRIVSYSSAFIVGVGAVLLYGYDEDTWKRLVRR